MLTITQFVEKQQHLKIASPQTSLFYTKSMNERPSPVLLLPTKRENFLNYKCQSKEHVLPISIYIN